MVVMKRLVFLLVCSGALLCAADLSSVRNVYVMPMSRGLDQYLAGRIASEGLFQVVPDPKPADGVLSEKGGDSLPSQLKNISPPPKPDVEKEEKPKKKDDPAASDDPNSIAKAMKETEN